MKQADFFGVISELHRKIPIKPISYEDVDESKPNILQRNETRLYVAVI